ALRPQGSQIQVYPVISAQEMYDQALDLFPQTDLAIMAAAVSDFRPARQEGSKIKKDKETLSLSLVRNPDILAQLGTMNKQGQRLVVLGLETDHALENAKAKQRAKNADLIILNSLEDEGAGFGGDTNKVTLIPDLGPVKALALDTKKVLARQIVDYVAYE